MIVDDHAATRAFLRELLAQFAGEVCECASGEEALTRCGAFQPDLVTMDLQMRPLDGLQATRRLLAELPAACVVMVTQSDAPALRLAAAQAGVRHYVHKDDLAELRRFAEQRDALHRALGVSVNSPVTPHPTV